MKALATALLCAALSGCAGLDAALDYTGTPAMPYADIGDVWRVFDKPAEGKLMITPSLEHSGQQGAVTGVTLGAINGFLPGPVYGVAARHYLASTGRACVIVEGYELILTQWEFRYRCQ